MAWKENAIRRVSVSENRTAAYAIRHDSMQPIGGREDAEARYIGLSKPQSR